MANIVGTIGAIMRFPVKSMLGESLDECDIVAGGVDGDRTHALVDPSTGKIASAKQPNLWRDLLAFSAKTNARTSAKTRSETNPAGIIVSDGGGNQIDLLDPDFDAKLSEWLGRKVRLIDVRPAGIELNRARPDEVMTRGRRRDRHPGRAGDSVGRAGRWIFRLCPAPCDDLGFARRHARRGACGVDRSGAIPSEHRHRNFVFPGICRERVGRPPAPHRRACQHRGDRADAALRGADAGCTERCPTAARRLPR